MGLKLYKKIIEIKWAPRVQSFTENGNLRPTDHYLTEVAEVVPDKGSANTYYHVSKILEAYPGVYDIHYHRRSTIIRVFNPIQLTYEPVEEKEI